MHDAPSAAPASDAPAPLRDGLWPMPPGPPHEEKRATTSEAARDLLNGIADGLTAPFALAVGLSAITASTSLIVAIVLVAITAAGIAMALGGYLAARTEANHYAAERQREEQETHDYPDREHWEVAAILHRYGVRGDALRIAVDSVCADRRRWVDFMMRFELDLDEPQPDRAARSAVTRGAAYAIGGLIPLLPFMALESVPSALALSCGVTGAALFAFGGLKARATGRPILDGAIQTLGVGAAAAAATYLVASSIGG